MARRFYYSEYVLAVFFSIFVFHPSFLDTEGGGSSDCPFLPFLIDLRYITTSLFKSSGVWLGWVGSCHVVRGRAVRCRVDPFAMVLSREKCCISQSFCMSRRVRLL